MSSTFTVDKHPIGFVVHVGVAGTKWQIPRELLTDDDKTFIVTQALISVDGDTSTIFRYCIHEDAEADCLLGHQLEELDEIMLRNPTAIQNLWVVCIATGTAGTLRVTLMG